MLAASYSRQWLTELELAALPVRHRPVQPVVTQDAQSVPVGGQEPE